MGIQINGQTDTISAVDNNFSLAGNVSIGGTLTYEDVTSVDAVGLSTFQAGIQLDDSITHLGDTDTKIRFPANDTFTVETGGSERLRITSAGKVGVGINSPIAKLHLVEATEGESVIQLNSGDSYPTVNRGLKIKSATGPTGFAGSKWIFDAVSSGGQIQLQTVSTQRLTIRETGKIGINTDNPISDLHVITPGQNEDGTFRVGGSATGLGLLIDYDQNGNTISKITSNPTYTNSNSLLKICVDGDLNANQLVLKGNGKVGINESNPLQQLHVSSTASTYIQVQNTGDSVNAYYGVDTASAWAGSSTDHPFKLHTNNTERLRITSDGRTLIHTSTAAGYSDRWLSIGDVTDASSTFEIRSSPTNGYSSIVFTDATSADTNSYIGAIEYAHQNNTLAFKTNALERLRITSTGDVGIGVNPEARLHIEENLSHSSTYYLNVDAHILVDNPGSGKAVIKLEGEAAIVYGGGSSTLIIADRQNERMRINSSGVVTQPNQPRFFATLSSTYSTYDGRNVGGTWIAFNNTVYNEGGHFKTSGSDLGRFVAPVNGMYLFRGSCYKGTSTTNWSQSWFDVDGSRANGTDWVLDSSRHAENSCQIYLTAGQKVGFHPYNNTQNNQIISTGNHTYFRGCLLH